MRPLSLKWFITTQRFRQTVGFLGAHYIRLVSKTSRFVIEPPDAYERVERELPVIVAMWHGQHLLMPAVKLAHYRAKVLISRHRDADINAIVAEHFGLGTIRGSGAHNTEFRRKGGALAFAAMVRALEDGYSVALTADVPKVARIVGRGIIMLARASGRPIYPLVLTTNRRIVLNNWDRSTVNLPFSRAAGVLGEPIRVPRDADDAAIEAARQELQARLDAITARAYEIADGRTGEA